MIEIIIINVNMIITIKISTCITKERAIKQGTLNKIFYKLIKLIKGLKDHRYIKDKCKDTFTEANCNCKV